MSTELKKVRAALEAIIGPGGEKAFAFLYAVMANPLLEATTKDRIRAAELLLAYQIGKPEAQVALTVDDASTARIGRPDLAALTVAELKVLAAERLTVPSRPAVDTDDGS